MDLRLNIGAGKTYIPGFRNIDIHPNAEIQLDVGQEPLPFPSDSVSVVFTYHTLEHIPNYLFALGEIHRVLRHDGVLLVGVPYVTLTEFNLVNPFHLHHFSEHSFSFFDPARLKGSAAEGNEIAFRQAFARFHYMGAFRAMPPPFRTWARRHLFNVVRRLDVGVVAIKDPALDVDVGRGRAHELTRLFDDCLRRRVKYKDPGADQSSGVA